jgi:hypothetical protein
MLLNNLDYRFLVHLLCAKYFASHLQYGLSKLRNIHNHVPKVIMLFGEFDSFSFRHGFIPKVLEIISLNLTHSVSMLAIQQMTLRLVVSCPKHLNFGLALASNDYCILKLQITSFFTRFSSYLTLFIVYFKEQQSQSRLH